jgi:murein L,D-transpeptidase YcbB/YkuD
LSGYAADIKITGVDPLKIALYADSVLGNSGGVELGSYDSGTTGYVHIDVRDAKWRAIRPKSSSTSYTSYSDMPPTVKSNASGAAVTVLSRKLRKLGYLKADSSTCNATVVAGIKAFQKANGLTADGVAGTKTWQKIADKL